MHSMMQLFAFASNMEDGHVMFCYTRQQVKYRSIYFFVEVFVKYVCIASTVQACEICVCVCIASTVQAQYIDAGWDEEKFLYLPLSALNHGLAIPTLHVCDTITIIMKKSTQSTSNLHMNTYTNNTVTVRLC